MQWRNVLSAHFQREELPPSAASSARPCEVTQVVSQSHPCPHCSQSFPTLIALRGHITRIHAATSEPPTATSARPTQRTLRHKFMSLALDGMPTCRLCLRTFAAWPPFLNLMPRNPAQDDLPGPPVESALRIYQRRLPPLLLLLFLPLQRRPCRANCPSLSLPPSSSGHPLGSSLSLPRLL